MARILPKDIKPNSIEEIVCKALDAKKKQPMNEQQSIAMLTFLFGGDEGIKLADDILEKQLWTANVLKKRLKAQFDRDLDSRVAVLIGLGGYSVGGCVLFTYYLQWKANELGIRGEITIKDFAEQIFPFGMFSEEDLSLVWKSQKVDNRDERFEDLEIKRGTDNLVDYGHAAQSLLQKTEA